MNASKLASFTGMAFLTVFAIIGLVTTATFLVEKISPSPQSLLEGTYFEVYGSTKKTDISLTTEGHHLIGTSDSGTAFDVSQYDRFIIYVPSSSGRIQFDAIGLDDQWVDSKPGPMYAHSTSHFRPTGAAITHPHPLGLKGDHYIEGPPDGITLENMVGSDAYYSFSTLSASKMTVYVVN